MSWLLPLPYPFVHPFVISALWFVAFAMYGRIKAIRANGSRSTIFEDLKIPAMMQFILLMQTLCVMMPCRAGERHCYSPHSEWLSFTQIYPEAVYFWSNIALWAGVLSGAFYVLRGVLRFFKRKMF